MYGSTADYFVYIGFFGLAIISSLFVYFLGRRIAWLFGIMFGMSVGSPNYKSGTLKFLVLFAFLMFFGVFTYSNFYSRAYAPYEKGKVSAEVTIESSTGDNSFISITIPRDEKSKTIQAASIKNGQYILVGENVTPPEWIRSFGAVDGFRFYGVIKSSYSSDYYDRPIDVNVSEKPGNFVWNILIAVQEFIPFADLEKHNVQFIADGYSSKFNVYVSKDGFKRD